MQDYFKFRGDPTPLRPLDVTEKQEQHGVYVLRAKRSQRTVKFFLS